VYILGISAYYHDSAAALIKDGTVVAAAQEERFTRKKYDARFPSSAIRYCLEQAGATGAQIDHVVFYDKPLLKFERLLDTYLAFSPRGFATFRASFPVWIKEKLFLKTELRRDLARLCSIDVDMDALLFSEHHLSHAASAFFPSPFEEAAVLTVDGVGEWTTTSLAHGKGGTLELLEELHFPNSLGLLYSAFTYYLGFKVNSGEYKVMGLAPYGEPTHADVIREHLIDIKENGTFRLNLEYFDYCTEMRMTNERFDRLFGRGPRSPGEPLTKREMDLAASMQAVTEDVMCKLARTAARETGSSNLCLAGGVALNCVANGKILREKAFENVWIQPAAGDAGGALGAAYAVHHMHLGSPRQADGRADGMKGALLGPAFSQEDIEERLRAAGGRIHTSDPATVAACCARELASGKIVGWFQGRMEFGPRALGARSILADARRAEMQSYLNLKTKFRESFRPFAPAVLREHASEWFSLDSDSPYMMIVADVRDDKRVAPRPAAEALQGIERLNQCRSLVPSVTHVDHSARVQTVDGRDNPLFHELLTRFHELTGCPILINTSFNLRGEPIVCSPEDAFRCFMSTGIDVLAIGNSVLYKEEQNPNLLLTPDPAMLDD
jgi:carbamoyltransferase